MSLPYWLFDELADHVEHDTDLRARLNAWDELLADCEELDPHEDAITRNAHDDAGDKPRRLDIARYRELRAIGVPAAAFYEQQRTDFWRPAIRVVRPQPQPRKTS